jgi:hypothetical protein
MPSIVAGGAEDLADGRKKSRSRDTGLAGERLSGFEIIIRDARATIDGGGPLASP